MSPTNDDIGVEIESRDGVARLTLDRPARRNAVTTAMAVRMAEALERWSMDDEVRVVVLAGRGDHFCAGMDLLSLNRNRAPRAADAPPADAGQAHPRRPRPRPGRIGRGMERGVNRLFATLWNIQVPTVAVVRGGAHGLGCGLALLADFTVAAEDARFSVPFVRRGFTPDSASSYLLPRTIGVARAKEMLLRGLPVDASTAERWGMIARAVPPGDLDATAEELVGELAQAATAAVGMAKWLLNRSLDAGLDDALRLEGFTEDLSTSSADFKAGITAFLAKEQPRFTGR